MARVTTACILLVVVGGVWLVLSHRPVKLPMIAIARTQTTAAQFLVQPMAVVVQTVIKICCVPRGGDATGIPGMHFAKPRWSLRGGSDFPRIRLG